MSMREASFPSRERLVLKLVEQTIDDSFAILVDA